MGINFTEPYFKGLTDKEKILIQKEKDDQPWLWVKPIKISFKIPHDPIFVEAGIPFKEVTYVGDLNWVAYCADTHQKGLGKVVLSKFKHLI